MTLKSLEGYKILTVQFAMTSNLTTIFGKLHQNREMKILTVPIAMASNVTLKFLKLHQNLDIFLTMTPNFTVTFMGGCQNSIYLTRSDIKFDKKKSGMASKF